MLSLLLVFIKQKYSHGLFAQGWQLQSTEERCLPRYLTYCYFTLKEQIITRLGIGEMVKSEQCTLVLCLWWIHAPGLWLLFSWNNLEAYAVRWLCALGMGFSRELPFKHQKRTAQIFRRAQHSAVPIKGPGEHSPSLRTLWVAVYWTLLKIWELHVSAFTRAAIF